MKRDMAPAHAGAFTPHAVYTRGRPSERACPSASGRYVRNARVAARVVRERKLPSLPLKRRASVLFEARSAQDAQEVVRLCQATAAMRMRCARARGRPWRCLSRQVIMLAPRRQQMRVFFIRSTLYAITPSRGAAQVVSRSPCAHESAYSGRDA